MYSIIQPAIVSMRLNMNTILEQHSSTKSDSLDMHICFRTKCKRCIMKRVVYSNRALLKDINLACSLQPYSHTSSFAQNLRIELNNDFVMIIHFLYDHRFYEQLGLFTWKNKVIFLNLTFLRLRHLPCDPNGTNKCGSLI